MDATRRGRRGYFARRAGRGGQGWFGARKLGARRLLAAQFGGAVGGGLEGGGDAGGEVGGAEHIHAGGGGAAGRGDAGDERFEVRAALEGTHRWDASTVKTLLRRLCEKGAVAAEKREVFYYRPVLTREAYRNWSTRSLIDKVYRGSAKDLVASLVERAQLSAQDLEDLRTVLYPEGEGGRG